MGRPIPVVADIPAAAPGFGFDDYVQAVADVVRGVQPARLTVGLYGAWGSGKSSLLSGLATELGNDERILVVRFDAWRYENSPQVLIPLLYSISRAAKENRRLTAFAKQVGRVLLSVASSLTVKTPLGVEINTARITDELVEKELRRLDAEFARPFDELANLPATLNGMRIAVLIDDLDRCSPDKVVGMLEAINVVTDIDGFIFVLALDYEVLVDAVLQRYPHVSGHAFIEKMIQLPFRVPPLVVGPDSNLAELIPNWQLFARDHPRGVIKIIREVCEVALRGNPRQVKRLVNYVLLLERIISTRKVRLFTEDLVPLVALQLAWPEAYRHLQELRNDSSESPLDALRASNDPVLADFTDRFMLRFDDRALLRTALQMTSAIDAVTPGQSETVRSSTARNQLEPILVAQGWRPVTPARDVWLLAAAPESHIQFRSDRVEILIDDGPDPADREGYEFSYDNLGALVSVLAVSPSRSDDLREWVDYVQVVLMQADA